MSCLHYVTSSCHERKGKWSPADLQIIKNAVSTDAQYIHCSAALWGSLRQSTTLAHRKIVKLQVGGWGRKKAPRRRLPTDWPRQTVDDCDYICTPSLNSPFLSCPTSLLVSVKPPELMSHCFVAETVYRITHRWAVAIWAQTLVWCIATRHKKKKTLSIDNNAHSTSLQGDEREQPLKKPPLRIFQLQPY